MPISPVLCPHCGHEITPDLARQVFGARYSAKGGKARARALTAEQRQEIARAASRKRWGPPKDR